MSKHDHLKHAQSEAVQASISPRLIHNRFCRQQKVTDLPCATCICSTHLEEAEAKETDCVSSGHSNDRQLLSVQVHVHRTITNSSLPNTTLTLLLTMSNEETGHLSVSYPPPPQALHPPPPQASYPPPLVITPSPSTGITPSPSTVYLPSLANIHIYIPTPSTVTIPSSLTQWSAFFATSPCQFQGFSPHMPHTHNPSHSHGNKCFCTPKSHCVLHNEDSDTEAESDWMDFEGIFEEYDLGPPYKFRKQVIDDCYKKATLRCNLAVQLVRKCYSKAERATSKCTGEHRYKKKKLSPARMQAVRLATFSIYPIIPGNTTRLPLTPAAVKLRGLRKDFSSSSVTVVNTILFIQLSYILLYCISCTVYFIYNLLYEYIATRTPFPCHCITS